MLYQLAIYALSQQERRVATILYPTLNDAAVEVHIVINDTIEGRRTGRVILARLLVHCALMFELGESTLVYVDVVANAQVTGLVQCALRVKITQVATLSGSPLVRS